MPPSPKTILISRTPGTPCDDLAEFARVLGCRSVEHDLGSVLDVDFEAIDAAFTIVPDKPEIAEAQTRRWRVALGERFRPIVWLAETNVAIARLAYRAGADDCLSRAFDSELLQARMQALQRLRERMDELCDRATEVTVWARNFSRLHDSHRIARELAFTTLHCRPPLPGLSGSLRFGYLDSSRKSEDTKWLEIREYGDKVRIVIGEVLGGGDTADCLIGAKIRFLTHGNHNGSGTPADVLLSVNNVLMDRRSDFRSVAIVVADLDRESGVYQIAQAGISSAIVYQANGESKSIPFHQPHLGLFEIAPDMMDGILQPGEKLLLGEGIAPEHDPGDHRSRPAQDYLDALGLKWPAVACLVERIAGM